MPLRQMARPERLSPADSGLDAEQSLGRGFPSEYDWSSRCWDRAVLEVRGEPGSEVLWFRPGAVLFTNRDYRLAECPANLAGKKFLRSSIDSTQFDVVRGGRLTVLTPHPISRAASRAEALDTYGFARTGQGRFQLFGSKVIDQVLVYEKQVASGESFSRRSVLPFDDADYYWAAGALDDGEIIVYTYNAHNKREDRTAEQDIPYVISRDGGRTWSDVRTTHFAKGIRNMQLSGKLGEWYFMHGRSGSYSGAKTNMHQWWVTTAPWAPEARVGAARSELKGQD